MVSFVVTGEPCCASRNALEGIDAFARADGGSSRAASGSAVGCPPATRAPVSRPGKGPACETSPTNRIANSRDNRQGGAAGRLPAQCGRLASRYLAVETLLLGLLVFFLFGFAARHGAAVAVPLVLWPVYFVGLHKRWWGCCGTGEGWHAALLWSTILSACATLLGVLTRHGLASARS